MLTSGCWSNGEPRSHSASSHCCSQTWTPAPFSQQGPMQGAVSGKTSYSGSDQRLGIPQSAPDHRLTGAHLTTGWHGRDSRTERGPGSNSRQRAQQWLVQGHMPRLPTKSSPPASLTSLWGVSAPFLRFSLACWKVFNLSCSRAGRDWTNPWCLERVLFLMDTQHLRQRKAKSLTKTPHW